MTPANPYQPPSTSEPPPLAPSSPDLGFYAPGGARATAAVAMLYIVGAIHALSIPAQIHRLVVLGKLNTPAFTVDEANLTDQLNAGVAILHLIALVGCAIAFCIWFYNAYRNMGYLGGIRSYSLGWAPGSFFVPFLNLVRPYQIAKETWMACCPLEEAYSGQPSHRPVTVWWAFFLTGNFVSNAAWRMMKPDSVERIQASTVMMIVADLLLVLAALVAVRVVKGIEQRQAARAAVQRTGTASEPPELAGAAAAQ